MFFAFIKRISAERMRRLRTSPELRDLVSETNINLNKLVMPVFVDETIKNPKDGVDFAASLNGPYIWDAYLAEYAMIGVSEKPSLS